MRVLSYANGEPSLKDKLMKNEVNLAMPVAELLAIRALVGALNKEKRNKLIFDSGLSHAIKITLVDLLNDEEILVFSTIDDIAITAADKVGIDVYGHHK